MEPTEKSPEIRRVLDQVFGVGPAIRKGQCSMCQVEVKGFRDNLSAKEYTISGLCQKCQDKVFAPPPDELDLDPDDGIGYQTLARELNDPPWNEEKLGPAEQAWYNDYLDQVRARNEQAGAEEKEGDPVDDYEGELPW